MSGFKLWVLSYCHQAKNWITCSILNQIWQIVLCFNSWILAIVMVDFFVETNICSTFFWGPISQKWPKKSIFFTFHQNQRLYSSQFLGHCPEFGIFEETVPIKSWFYIFLRTEDLMNKSGQPFLCRKFIKSVHILTGFCLFSGCLCWKIVKLSQLLAIFVTVPISIWSKGPDQKKGSLPSIHTEL
jgi:hypothetical protein